MKNKEPDWFISSLRWSFAAITLILLFLGVYSFIYYSTISLDSKISSFFSFISSLGIVAACVIYIKQKNHSIETEIKKNIRIDDSISKILLMECERIGYHREFMQKSYMFLVDNKPSNLTVKKEGTNYYVAFKVENHKEYTKVFYKIDDSRLMGVLNLAVNSNSKYLDTVYKFIEAIEMVNTNLDNLLFDGKYMLKKNNIYNMSLNDLYLVISEIYH
ncbi:hypothetical protein [Morganella psychrotolerans]|uniref:Uncharacterized protein n=1 Tax=Morganella psychrotolerans TaxID=368603 RepID=A0A1B8HKT4_9GAMM|nr:hypothetical protein [Morganella psychrotolerans]OBU09882.1 hypothetical protein AYY18_18910 [Morganella psychrotolerans]